MTWDGGCKAKYGGDASAALGIIHRRGLGKTRHIETGHLWIQETAAKERLKFRKVLGKDNPADLFTKYLDEQTTNHHLRNLEYRFEGGRAEEAPQFHMMSQSRDECNVGRNAGVCDWLNMVLSEIEIARGHAQGRKWRGEDASSPCTQYNTDIAVTTTTLPLLNLYCETPAWGALLQVQKWNLVNPVMQLGRRWKCPMGYANAGWVSTGHGAIWCRGNKD